jgi:hypothetical protein
MVELSLNRHSDESIMAAQAAAPATTLPSAACQDGTLNDFVTLNDLDELISAGAELASRCFDLHQPVNAEFVSDQETGEKWVDLVILAKGDIAAVRQARRRFTREWLRLVPLEKALLIRPALSLV